MKSAYKKLTTGDLRIGMQAVVSDAPDATIYTVEGIDRFSVNLSYKLRDGRVCTTQSIDVGCLQLPTVGQLTRPS